MATKRSTTSTLPFCPQCKSLMNYTGSVLTCDLCEYTEPIASKTKLRSTIYKANVSANVNRSVIYDQSLRRTCKIKCANKECPSNDTKLWGTRTDDGILVQPEMVITNYHDKDDRVNTYICRVCKTTTIPSLSVDELLK